MPSSTPKAADGGPEDPYFEKLAAQMNDILDAAGVPLCKGGVMAKQQGVAQERRRLAGDHRGLGAPPAPAGPAQRRHLLRCACRCTARRRSARRSGNYAYECGHAARDFQNVLIETARQRGSAFTLLGNFKLDEQGPHRPQEHGLMPMFTSARVLSIRHDVRARSTAERLDGVAAKGVGSPELIQAINDAHRLILGAVIAQQLVEPKPACRPPPMLHRSGSTRPARPELKNALLAVEEAVGLASEGRL